MKNFVCQSNSDGVTQAFGRKLAMNLTKCGTLLLRGDLGAGKTTFTQGLAEGLHIQQRITSPTFTLMAVYDNLSHPIVHRFVHIDLYRINDLAEVESLDLATWQADPHTLVVVEWPERAPQLWHNILGTIELSIGQIENQHLLTISGEIIPLLQ